ncbi:MAG: ABC transporter ATP-binding protein [Planctomycetes bacterium]|nr:ABC transporter ATP-binding protein [Planctomycetota bacterium]
MNSENIAIQINDLHYAYPDGNTALNGINLSIKENENIALIGHNGAGKSTLILHLNGILSGSGTIRIFNMEVNKGNLKEIRRTVGIVFQDPEDQLFCPTVYEDVAFGPRNMGMSENEVDKRVKETLSNLGLTGFEKRSAHHLSFGEKKRVSIATVLSMSPRIMVFDEPTANLDPAAQQALMETIKSFNCTKIIVTQDMPAAAELCERLIIMNKGVIAADGKTLDILSNDELLTQNGLSFKHYCKICKIISGMKS